MTKQEIVRLLKRGAILALHGRELPGLLAVAETLRAIDTCVAGVIRVLSLGGLVLVEETTPDGGVLLRRAHSREAADLLVELRLEEYRKLWEGRSCELGGRGPV